MSYILDALRKSERERQIAAGQGVGMLFPAAPEYRPEKRRKVVLVGSALLLLSIAINAWLWHAFDRSLEEKPTAIAPLAGSNGATPANRTEIPAAPPPNEKPSRPEAKRPAPEPSPAPAPRPASKAPVHASDAAPAAKNGATAGTSGAGKKEEAVTLPPVSISGYIKDPAGGSLAIVNNRLVREGDEVSPGLRLEKVDGESAVFSYKGQRFSR